jgi:hypothetical protein
MLEKQSGGQALGWMAVACAAFLLVLTQSPYLGDTALYCVDIILAKELGGAGSRLWEFGHLLLRPVGWVLMQTVGPAVSRLSGLAPMQTAAVLLIALNIACGLATAALWAQMARIAGCDWKLALLLASGLFATNPVLSYTPAGSSYVIGLFFCTVALWFAQLSGSSERKAVHAWMMGGAMAMSILFWLPYILVAPAVFLFAAGAGMNNWSLSGFLEQLNQRKYWLTKVMFAFGLLIVACYGSAIFIREMHSVSEVRAWFSDSSHGMVQNRSLVRMGTALPRLFFYLGDDALLFKRYLFRDPYAPVTALDLVRASLWKLAVAFLFLALLVWLLARRKKGRWPLLYLTAAAAPLLFFALVLFEPGSPERFMPVLPFLLLALTSLLKRGGTVGRVGSVTLAGFFVSVMAANVTALFRPSMAAKDDRSYERIRLVVDQAPAKSVAVVLSYAEDAHIFITQSLLHPGNRKRVLPTHALIILPYANADEWKEMLADRALRAWREGGDVWVTKRVWAERPKPDWMWAEGDDPRLRWKDIPAFFAGIKVERENGGEDGFALLARGGTNQELFERLVSKR